MIASTPVAMRALSARWIEAARPRFIAGGFIVYVLRRKRRKRERRRKNGPHVRPVFHCSNDYVRQLAGRYFGRMLVPELVGSQNHTVIGGAAVPAAVAQFTGLLGAGV